MTAGLSEPSARHRSLSAPHPPHLDFTHSASIPVYRRGPPAPPSSSGLVAPFPTCHPGVQGLKFFFSASPATSPVLLPDLSGPLSSPLQNRSQRTLGGVGRGCLHPCGLTEAAFFFFAAFRQKNGHRDWPSKLAAKTSGPSGSKRLLPDVCKTVSTGC